MKKLMHIDVNHSIRSHYFQLLRPECGKHGSAHPRNVRGWSKSHAKKKGNYPNEDAKFPPLHMNSHSILVDTHKSMQNGKDGSS